MNTESCDMTRCHSVEDCLDGPAGSFFIETQSNGQRLFWFVLPNGTGTFIHLRPVVDAKSTRHSWEWDGDADKPTLTPSVNCVDIWHGWFTAGRMVSC